MATKKISIVDMQLLARSRGGDCTSKVYVRSSDHLNWVCSHDHKWKATANNIKSGKWCPKCAQLKKGNSQRESINDMHKLAKYFKGKCLSRNYINARTKLRWKCSKGHEWESTSENIKRGNWCPICGKGIKTIEYMQELAKAKGGVCLSPSYGNSKTKLEWRCSKGHEWKTVPAVIMRGGWCPDCGGRKKLTIQVPKSLAKMRGGKCISVKYERAKSKLEWECNLGHRWKAPYDQVRSGTWCPKCGRYIGEEIVRWYFEKLFNRKFPKKSSLKEIPWLKTEEGFPLELDGYCKSKGVAFEHQGRQHYEEAGIFSVKMSLRKRKDLDNLKRKLCKKNGVKLIEIPEVFSLTPVENLGDLIIEKCKKNGIALKRKKIEITDIELNSVYINRKLEKLAIIAKEKGGKLLSKTYFRSNEKLEWECEDRHRWFAVPSSIKLGCWCPKCAGNAKKSLVDMNKIAKKMKGKCLSKDYRNVDSKLLWECRKGHQWEAVPSLIMKGSWCPKCSGRQNITLKILRDTAKKKGGKCLSKEYVNNSMKMKWECNRGHRWETAAQHIRAGKWCIACHRVDKGELDRKSTLEKIKCFAEKKKGKCLNKKYLGTGDLLKFRCREGHLFSYKIHGYHRNRWCRECDKNKK